MDIEWRKKLQREQNHVASKDGNEEAAKIIQKELSLDAIGKGTCSGLTETKSVARTTPKPSKFNAYSLTIGVWQWISRYNGDLVAKFYYAHRKLIWEVIYEGLKWKIEIDWEGISAMKVSSVEGGPATLEIMLSQRPRFYKEINQQPRKSTSWLQTIDFTDGQSNINRRHVLQCEPAILNKHIAILLSSNYPLYSLSQENCWLNPYFENQHLESEVPESSNNQGLSRHFDSQQLGGQKTGMDFHVPVGVVRRNHSGSQDGMPTVTTGSVPGQSSVITEARSVGLQNLAELELNHYASGTSSQQTFEQMNSATQPRNNDSNGTMIATVLEKITHDLFDDIYMEPRGMAEDARVMPMPHSFSNLLQQNPAPGNSAEAATEVLSMPPNVVSNDGSSSGTTGRSDNCLLPSMLKEGVPWEINMDPAYMLESFPFLP